MVFFFLSPGLNPVVTVPSFRGFPPDPLFTCQFPRPDPAAVPLFSPINSVPPLVKLLTFPIKKSCSTLDGCAPPEKSTIYARTSFLLFTSAAETPP